MNISGRFKRVFSYTWYLYLIALVCPTVVFPVAYSFMHRPQDFEKLCLFVSSDIKDSSLNKVILEEFKDDGVKDVDIVSCNYHDSIYLEKLTVVGYSKADLLILPEDILSYLNIPAAMQEFDSHIKQLCDANSYEFYDIESVSYGIKLNNDYLIVNYLELEPEENYYLFIGGNSQNIGEYSNSPNHSSNAFNLIQYLLK